MDFIRTQWTPIPYPTHSFANQTIIVTGANIGLGLEAARHFVRLGASKVVLGCRSLKKGQEAAESIAQSTNRNVCEVWEVDVGNFDSVKKFCKRAEALERLDAVVENAGVANSYFEEEDGMEVTVRVNVVGTFLMALNLLPVLRASRERNAGQPVPRLVIVTSEVHFRAKMAERHEDSIFDTLKNKSYIADRYNTSKLLEVFTVRTLAQKTSSGPHANQPVILNMLNPGLCHSSLSRGVLGIVGMFLELVKLLIARTTEVGGRTLVASAAAGEESHGQYMSECKVREPSEFVRSGEGKKTQERVYGELMGILEGIQPGITTNI